MTPRLDLIIYSGSKKRNPDMNFLFLSIVPVNEPLQVPQQGPYGERGPFTEPLLHIPQIPHKKFPK
jgi:hypothetical protein